MSSLRPPEYGSPAWFALAEDDPARMAAVWLAAECWRRYWEPDALAWRRRATERAFAERVKAAACDLSAALDWSEVASRHVPHAELARRRTEPHRPPLRCAEPGCGRVFPRPDYRPGDPTPWSGPRCPAHRAIAGTEAA